MLRCSGKFEPTFPHFCSCELVACDEFRDLTLDGIGGQRLGSGQTCAIFEQISDYSGLNIKGARGAASAPAGARSFC